MAISLKEEKIKKLIDSWEKRAHALERNPKEFNAAISLGMKVCIKELAKLVK